MPLVPKTRVWSYNGSVPGLELRFKQGDRLTVDVENRLPQETTVHWSLSVIDTNSLAEVVRIPVGKTPVQVGFTPDGGRVYVSLRDENRIAVVDTATRTMVGTIDVGRNPVQVHATPNGQFVYVANQGTDAEPADTVSVIDTAAGSVVDTIRTGRRAHGVGVSDDGAFVFVTNIVDDTVSVFDAMTLKVVATFAVGRGPNGITHRPTQG